MCFRVCLVGITVKNVCESEAEHGSDANRVILYFVTNVINRNKRAFIKLYEKCVLCHGTVKTRQVNFEKIAGIEVYLFGL